MEDETPQQKKNRKAREYYYANKEACQKRNKEYYEQNREQEIQRRKEWHAANREKQNVKRRKWREEHLEYSNQKCKDWYAENKETEKPKHKAHYEANREKYTALRRQWYLDHKEHSQMQEYVRKKKIHCNKPWIALIHSSVHRARKKEVPHTLTHEWAEANWTGICAVSGLPFSIGGCGSGAKFYSPSIDRIIPEIGYTPENCRFVLWAVNALKGIGTDSDMYHVVEAIYLKNSYKSIP